MRFGYEVMPRKSRMSEVGAQLDMPLCHVLKLWEVGPKSLCVSFSLSASVSVFVSVCLSLSHSFSHMLGCSLLLSLSLCYLFCFLFHSLFYTMTKEALPTRLLNEYGNQRPWTELPESMTPKSFLY